MSTTTPQPWPIAITQANALYLAVLCGSWICAGVAGWWLSVPIPVSDSAYVLPMFVHGMIASIVMSFIWLHVTGLETWQVAVRRGIWIIVSSAPVFFLATTRGSTRFPEVWQIWRAVIVDNHASAQRLTTNHWWCLAFVQCLVCVSLWMCTLPLWKQLRWHREHPLARQSWLPNLILGCSGLVIVSMIQGFINYQYRYPRFGPTAVKELAEHSLNAAVFSFLFPAPLLLLKSERVWSIVTFFGLIIALSLGLWFADAQGRLGVFGGYSSWYQLRDALQISIGSLGFHFTLGIFFVLWRIQQLATESNHFQRDTISTTRTNSAVCPQPTQPSYFRYRPRLIVVSWILITMSMGLLPVFLEPVTLFKNAHPAASWNAARLHARILSSCKRFGTRQQAILAMNDYPFRREFPKWFTVDETRAWQLIVTKQTAMNENFLAELEQL